ncbi:MAG TPA: hypothetical protein VJH21_01030 [Candidatus Paceibacterota bacterium]
MEALTKISLYGNSAVAHTRELSIASIVVIVTTVFLFIFAIQFGKDRIIAFILALYIGLLTFLNFPYTEKFLLFKESESGTLISHGIIYLVFVLLSYVITERLVWAEYPPRSSGRFVEAFILAISGAVFLLSFAYNILPIASSYSFVTPIELLFAPSQFFFWWLILPLVSIFILTRR